MRIPKSMLNAPQPDLPEAPQPHELDPIVETFSAMARLRRETADALPGIAPGLAYDPDRFASGEPLLADQEPQRFAEAFRQAGAMLLPRLGELLPAIAREAAILTQALAQGPRVAGPIIGFLLEGSEGELTDLAGDMGLPPATQVFLGREILSVVLRREAGTLAPLADDSLWKKSYCPVCGAAPDMGMLREKQEPSEFLISKAGRLMLHCSLCGHFWHFPRLVCPSCGEGDHEKLGLLIPAGRERERIHTCATCGKYLIVLNRVDSEADFDPDVAPAKLIHLDAAAQEKGFAPVCETPLNQLGAGE